ncbi:carotenoid biosynthesis protein [Cecembia calidifontis]|jgi:putative membrane protein|uniref:Putative membrane protein n=1 Tax=Cecembia calidifontis TaxID=1187080 RepID=A0A4Q7P6M2_9BACT|nr:carotenoid biosynthesis protein [Cecembia calidifontis]RZS95625.1 putative membrane protein [Cecembia calidifontis]
MSYQVEQKLSNSSSLNLKESKKKKLPIIEAVITIIYLVGIVGMSIPEVRPYFQQLTPYQLLFTLGIMLSQHRDWNDSFIRFMAAAFLIGYGSEVSGVHTGFPFGNYQYGPVLGPQLFEVPIMIGVNWLILIYLTGTLLNNWIKNDFLAALIGSFTMVLIDFAIEPVAIALDFWSWENNIIPLSNYLGWFGVAFIIQMIFRKAVFTKENKITAYLLANLIAFFVILNFIL